mgnify:CR=1 FL=1
MHQNIGIMIGNDKLDFLRNGFIEKLKSGNTDLIPVWGKMNFQQMIEGYLRKRENLKHVFVLLDGRHSPQKIDLDFLHDLGKWNIPFSLVFTKIDKEKQTEYNQLISEQLDNLKSYKTL